MGGFQAAGQAEEHTGWMAGSYGVGDPGARRTWRVKGPMTCHQVWCDEPLQAVLEICPL